MSATNRGMALIAVLWVTSLLALMAAGIGSSARSITKVTYNRVENAKARLAAEAGVQRAIFDLLMDQGDRYWQRGTAIDNRIEFDETRAVIRVRDEDGKIDINVAPIRVIEGLHRAIGLEASAANSLAARIVDYRDQDSEPGPSGAEDPDYVAEGRLDGAADRPFRNVAELRNVLGLTDAVYGQLRPYVTVYSDAQGVDPLRASAVVLNALPGMTPEALESILNQPTDSPDSDPFAGLPTDLAEEIDDYLLPSRELVYEIQAIGESAGGGRIERTIIVSLDGGQDDLPFTVYEWH